MGVRPVVYSPKKAFQLSDTDKAKYKEIAAAVSKKAGSADAKAALAKVQAAVGLIEQDICQDFDDTLDVKGKDFVGVVLGGPGGGGVVCGGDLEVTDDVYVEEPRIVAEADDDDDADERSLWGDGDNDPAEAEE